MSIRNERRRRLLADDSLAGASDEESLSIRLAAGPAGEAGPGAAAYAPAARHARQRPMHDLVPLRLTMIGLVVAGALSLVGVVTALAVWSPALAEIVSTEELLPLSLGGSRNLAHALASTLLLIASLMSILIYSLRRHRVDDYHGRYRLWIWAALACLVASCAGSGRPGRSGSRHLPSTGGIEFAGRRRGLARRNGHRPGSGWVASVSRSAAIASDRSGRSCRAQPASCWARPSVCIGCPRCPTSGSHSRPGRVVSWATYFCSPPYCSMDATWCSRLKAVWL